MARYNNNRGVGIIGEGVLGEIENSRFLSEHVTVMLLIHLHVNSGSVECTF